MCLSGVDLSVRCLECLSCNDVRACVNEGGGDGSGDGGGGGVCVCVCVCVREMLCVFAIF